MDTETEDNEDSSGTPGNDIGHPQPISQLLFFQCSSKRVFKEAKLWGFSGIWGKHFPGELKEGRIREEKKHKKIWYIYKFGYEDHALVGRSSVSIFIEWEMTGWPGHRLRKTWKWIKESHESCHRERGAGAGIGWEGWGGGGEKKDTASLSVKIGGDWVAQRNKVGDEDDLKKGKLLAVMEKPEWCTLQSVITCSM